MADVSELVDYYVNLLIIQYHNQQKAQATIRLLAETILANGVILDTEEAYNIAPALGDTAVGPQLDVIGKYVGVNRYFAEINYGDYFALVPYLGVPGSLPSSPPAFGFETYATFPTSFDYNGTLVYDDIVTSQNALSDANFLVLIQLAILRNNMNFSNGAIDEGMWALFGNQIRPETGGNMTIIYFIDGPETTLIQAILAKKLLPKPMGVRLLAVVNITGLMFAFTDYSGYESPFGYGFSTYSNYATLPGETLTYSQISGY